MSLWKHRSQQSTPWSTCCSKYRTGEPNTTKHVTGVSSRALLLAQPIKTPYKYRFIHWAGIVFTYKHTSAISCFQAATRWQSYLSTKVRTMFKRSKQILNRSNSQDYHELDKLLPSIYFQTLVLNEGIKINIFVAGNSIKMFRPVKVWYLFINLHNGY